jgi:hypothetical protein
VQADVPLRSGADEGALAGVDQERPVRTGLALEQPAEEPERGVEGVPGQVGDEGPLDHEVRALTGTDFIAQHSAHDVGVGVVGDVEVPVGHPRRHVRQAVEGLHGG